MKLEDSLDYLGLKVRDKICGIEGIVTSVTKYIDAVDRLTIDPGKKGEKELSDAFASDVPVCEIINCDPIISQPKFPDILPIKLGDLVKSKITGWQGIAVHMNFQLTGCIRVFARLSKDDEREFRKDFVENIQSLIVVEKARDINEDYRTGPATERVSRENIVSR